MQWIVIKSLIKMNDLELCALVWKSVQMFIYLFILISFFLVEVQLLYRMLLVSAIPGVILNEKTNHRELCTTWFHICKYVHTPVILICFLKTQKETVSSFCLLGWNWRKESFTFHFIQFIIETIGHMYVWLIFIMKYLYIGFWNKNYVRYTIIIRKTKTIIGYY